MPLFYMDPQRIKRRIKRFEKICDGNKTLINCYRNRVELGCKYAESTEKQLEVIDKLVSKYEDPPSWVSLLD
jgi:hypothetical protein